jgi:hypothetical protein
LFHGSGTIDPVANLRKSDEPFFFGLDAFVAIWYISEWAQKYTSDLHRLLSSLSREQRTETEKIEGLAKFDSTKWTKEELDKMRGKHNARLAVLAQKETQFTQSVHELADDEDESTVSLTALLLDSESHARRYAFLNIYETQMAIPYKYLGGSITKENPLDDAECKKIACLHPQFGYHSYALHPPVELSMEFTIPTDQLENKLKLVGVYVVDISKLKTNRAKTFSSFKATDAIVLSGPCRATPVDSKPAARTTRKSRGSRFRNWWNTGTSIK